MMDVAAVSTPVEGFLPHSQNPIKIMKNVRHILNGISKLYLIKGKSKSPNTTQYL